MLTSALEIYTEVLPILTSKNNYPEELHNKGPSHEQ